MKITIIESKEHKFTPDEYKFLQLLEEDSVFENLVLQARAVIGIPPEGFNIKEGHNLKDDATKRRIKLRKITIAIRGLYNLPPYWLIILSFIIYYNIAEAVDRKKLPHFYFEKAVNSVTIHIKENMSIRELKRQIDLNSDELKSLLQSLPGIPQIKIENIKVKKRILELNKAGKRDAEIARIIEEEFGDNLSFSPEYYIISILRKRFEKSLDIILKKDVARAKSKFKIKSPSQPMAS